MAKDLAAAAKAKNIKYFLVSFVDLLGQLRAKLVPASAIRGMQKNGAGFAGFATWLDMTPAHPDMFAVPDPDSLVQLPWKPEVGWLAADLWMNGKPVEASPRVALKRQIEAVWVRNYLSTMVLEIQTLARACGKSHVLNLEPEDLAALTLEAAAMAKVPLAGTDWIPGNNK